MINSSAFQKYSQAVWKTKIIGKIKCMVSFCKYSISSVGYNTEKNDFNLLYADQIEKLALWNCFINSFCNSSLSESISSNMALLYKKEIQFSNIFSKGFILCRKAKACLFLQSEVKPGFCLERFKIFLVTKSIDDHLENWI